MATATGPLTTRQRDGKTIPIGLAAVKIYKGAAASIVIGTGTGTPLVPGTVADQFIGVWNETYDNTAGTGGAPGTAGGHTTFVERAGLFAFSQTGTTITIAHIGKAAYFSDDNTITLTAGTTYAGVIAAVDENGNVWVDISQAVRQSSNAGKDFVALSGAADAINPHVSASYIVTTAGVDAMTLAAPTAGVDDGLEIIVSSGGAHAHTITAAGLFNTGTASVNLATFAAYAGAGVQLRAYNGKWNVISSTGITFT